MKSMQPTQSLFIANVYRPPGSYTAFLIEFPEFPSDLVVIADNIPIFGEFNIHMEKSTDTTYRPETRPSIAHKDLRYGTTQGGAPTQTGRSHQCLNPLKIRTPPTDGMKEHQ